ncbi:MAG: ComEA family DNA-binding protein [Coriobacteriales bacterium]|nr:ComEA family DNA-binding protein [Coriobacteriales bacterium]
MAQREVRPRRGYRKLVEHIGDVEHPHAVVALCIIIIAICLFATLHLSDSPRSSGSAVVLENGSPTGQATGAPAAEVFVDVEGAVLNPTVYSLPAGSRVIDAIEAAGGTVEGASPGSLNLARELVDGEQVRVPTEDEVGAAAQLDRQTADSDGYRQEALINLNTADAKTLQELPGIGEVTARKIVDDRTSNGPFRNVEDLQRVSGIGAAKFAQLKDRVCV